MTNKKHIAVLMGGLSAEREVSLNSGKAVSKALTELGYKVTDIDASHDLAQKLAEIKPDIAFNALHGTYGEDGSVQGLLEFMQIPYTHSGVGASAICMNKEYTQRILKSSGLKIAENKFCNILEVKPGIMDYPFVLKPISEGSSVGVSIIKNDDDLAKAKSEWNFGPAMVEKYIPGRELSVAVLEDTSPKALGVIELKPNQDFYDYKAKYTDGVTEHIMPAKLTESETAKIKQMAESAHKILKCHTLSRSDFRFDGAEFYFLEVNTHPGMTELSLVPEIADFVGIKFKDLVEILVSKAKLHNS